MPEQTEVLHVKMDSETKEALVRLAAENERTMSQQIRQLIRQAVAEAVPSQDTTKPAPPSLP